MSSQPETRSALRISGAFALFAALWIYASDWLLASLVTDPHRLTHLQNIKGWAFVLAATALLYTMIRGNAIAVERERREADADLHRNRVLLNAIVEGTNDAVYVKDEQGKYLLINQAALTMTGLTSERVIGHDDTVLFGPDDAGPVMEGDRRVMEGGMSVTFEETITLADGEAHTFLTTKGPIRDAEGRIVALFGIARDITERKKSETDLQDRNMELTAIGRIVGATATELDLQAVLDRALQGALEVTGLEGGTLCLVDHDTRTLHLAANVNTSVETVQDLTQNTIRIGDCLCGHAADTGRPLILWDNASGSEYATREATRNEGIRFHAAFPLMVKERSIGILCVFDRGEKKPKESSLKILEDLCGLVALAIENARLFDAERTAGQRIASILESISDAFVALDKDWRYTYVNRRAGELFGRRPEDLIGKHIWTEFPEGVGQPFHLAYERAMAEQVPIQIENYYEPWDRWFENLIYPSLEGLTIYFHEITERKRAEKETLRERDFSDTIINSLPGVFYFYDENLKFLRWNKNFERVTGYTGAEIARMSPLDFFVGTDKELLKERIQEVFDKRESDVEADFVSKDGTHTPYYFTGLTIQVNGRPCLLGVGIDISERRKAEAQLRESEARFRSIFEQAAVGVAQVGLDGRWLMVNEKLCAMIGYNHDELLRLTFQDITHPGDLDKDLSYVRQMLAGEIPTYSMEKRYFHKNGHIVWINLTVGLVRDTAGQPSYFISVVEDISRRKEYEEEVRRLNVSLERRVAERTAQLQAANQQLEAFSYSVSHDLRAPLRAISGFSQILARRHRATMNDEGQRYMDNIVLASERMGQLIDDLLAYSRLGRKTVTLQSVKLAEVLGHVTGDLAARISDIGGVIEVSENLPAVSGDPTLLGQIFSNLIGNAITYRRVDVSSHVKVYWREEADEIVVVVEDNGIGIAEEFHEKIFNVFQRLHSEDEYPGTGIGLAIVKKSVEMLGGKVWVESKPGEGSTFFVQLEKVSG